MAQAARAGETVGAFATFEPAASSDLSPAAVATRAERDGEGWVLNGRKRWITNSVAAGFVVVLAGTGERLSTFIVATDTPGVSIGTPDRKLGNKGQITTDVILDDVRLGREGPARHRGRRPQDRAADPHVRPHRDRRSRRRDGPGAFDHTAEYLRTRHAFGGPLPGKQYWQFLMADRATEIELAPYLKAAPRLDSGIPFPEPEAAMAKLYGTRLAGDIARDAVQALGGFGFTAQGGTDDAPGPVEAFYRDSKIGEVYEGANEVEKWVIARQVFGRDITA